MEEVLRQIVREEIERALPAAIRRARRRFVDAATLSEWLGVSVRTIRAWQRAGRLPYIKAGRRTLFDLEEVERLVAEDAIPARWVLTEK